MAVAGVLAVLAPTVFYPYGRDQSVFACAGSVIARGGMPYRDIWEIKPPGIYLAYALLARLAPDHGAGLMHAVRAADLAVAALLAVVLVLLVGELGRLFPTAVGSEPTPNPAPASVLPTELTLVLGPAAAAWYAALYLNGGFWCLAQTEAWANLPALAACLFCLRSVHGHHPARTGFLAGVLAGLAAVTKFTALLPVLPFFLLVLYRCRNFRWPWVASFAAGFFLPLAAAATWLAAGHAWEPYREIQRGFVAPYAQSLAGNPGRRLANLVGYTSGWLLRHWFPTLLAGVALAASRRNAASGRLLAAAGLLAGFAAVWVQNKYFGYHWQSALPFLALLAAAGAALLLLAAGVRPERLSLAGVVLAVAWSVSGHWPDYRGAALRAAHRLPREAWLARFGPPNGGDFSFLADAWMADYARRHTRPEQSIFVWGFEPAVYLLADRHPPTRFYFSLPVTSPLSPAAWKDELMADLRAHPPELFLALRHDAVPWASGRADDSAAQLEAWPELRAWLALDYRLETRIEDFTVYRRRSESGPGSSSSAPPRNRVQ